MHPLVYTGEEIVTECNILIASGGRRPYLVSWFREALRLNGVSGKVVLADCDLLSPAGALADAYVRSPLVCDDDYEDWLAHTLCEYGISLAISVNDYELWRWANLPADAAIYSSLLRLRLDMQETIEDKVRTSTLLEWEGIRSPVTLLASDALKLSSHELSWLLDAEELIVKGRFGSGSKGLQVTKAKDLRAAVTRAREEVTDCIGSKPLTAEAADDLIIIQPRIQGQEYGLDIIADLAGSHVGTLPRKKLSMRSGETDRAITESTDEFCWLGEHLTAALGHRGLIDVDLIRDADGNQWVIDINPRFGGGYPFSHVAGAHVPAAYVAWTQGRMPDPAWVQSDAGVVGAKCVDIVPVQSPARQTRGRGLPAKEALA